MDGWYSNRPNPLLKERIEELQKELEEHQKEVGEELQKYFDESRTQIVDFYLPRAMKTPPDALRSELLSGKPTKDDARRWLGRQLDKVFPEADTLIEAMKLQIRFKGITFETLNHKEFLESVKKAYPDGGWEKPYEEFLTAKENSSRKGEP